jgi:hypothetical protein
VASAPCVFTPLIRALENGLPSIKIGRHTQHEPVIPYADDVTVFFTNPGDFHAIEQAIHLRERETEARLSPRKSKALAIGAWTGPPTSLCIVFHECVNILGVEFGCTIATSIRDSWSKVICAVRAQVRRAYTRHLCLVQRMKYIQPCIFAKIWLVSQIFPLPHIQAQQLMSIISWYLWQGATFRVPIVTLKRPRHDGVRGLPNVVIKCKTLLYNRITMLVAKVGNVTTDLLRYWRVPEAVIKPPTPPASQRSLYISDILSAAWFMWPPPLHPTKQVNFSSGGYIIPYTYSQ